MIQRWHRLSSDWKRWARWWSAVAVVSFLGWRFDPIFWLLMLALIAIVPAD